MSEPYTITHRLQFANPVERGQWPDAWSYLASMLSEQGLELTDGDEHPIVIHGPASTT